MSAPEQTANEDGGAAELLSAQVDSAAVQIVLGALDRAEQIARLESIAATAETLGRSDIARLISCAAQAASRTQDPADAGSLLSDCISRVQQALQAAGPAPGPSAAQESTSSSVSLGEDRELLADFLLEAREHLSQVELQIITLEKEPHQTEAINAVFRAFHTIKGLAGFLALDDIREVAHETETLLDLARNRKLIVSPAIVDVVLAAADYLKALLTNLEERLGGVETGPVPDKIGLLERIQRAGSSAVDDANASRSPDTDPDAPASDPAFATSAEPAMPERRSGEDRRHRAFDAQSVKVETAKLDYLVDMAGELVIAESMVRHRPELAQLHSPAVLNSLAQLARITSELQKTAMSMRMVPIDALFQRMNRLVRDLARKTGKKVELQSIGGETELDRNVVEELADPLMHMVRNAIDHGLESEKERVAAGKHPAGRVRLRASHQAGHIVIEIADDGRGLNRDRILEKARTMGIVEEAAALSESEIFDLIFHPGFSTAAQVTDVSGRGVGMDVVRKKIQKLRGHVAIESASGQGTTFTLRLPLTLAIIDGLVVGVGSERYVVPIFSVREMLRPEVGAIFTVEGTHEMAMVRERLLPVVRLYRRFGVRPRSEEPTKSLLIVAEAGGRSFCLMVDDLIGKQEVVIKSLGETIQNVPGVAGGAILGDGRVGLILDLEGVFDGGRR
ncbi:chemotaxis protein CheA [Occallatibacter savannae]|uniref:chemotaxis protein CheA n=1 Tax=Occallatibacter savannae TaxID=1002691 RepID=UPI000D68926A|nr:chemotaxis protein CheA [Occallatibacter savannae]